MIERQTDRQTDKVIWGLVVFRGTKHATRTSGLFYLLFFLHLPSHFTLYFYCPISCKLLYCQSRCPSCSDFKKRLKFFQVHMLEGGDFSSCKYLKKWCQKMPNGLTWMPCLQLHAGVLETVFSHHETINGSTLPMRGGEAVRKGKGVCLPKTEEGILLWLKTVDVSSILIKIET